ncbi:hypothetical protein M9H77_28339 [Catharanthus roseus]|uniref:Uncharacterized protein n=1 Tax=Catharanthus roseus TaxID=4058 RepID=A0ACC0AFP0_CATRO|nr:hypothetical protein M9H77_28339 [Catharanthus roseus]
MVPIVFIIFFLPFFGSSENLQWLHRGPSNFLGCFSYESKVEEEENLVHTFWSNSYSPLLDSRLRNLRFNASETTKPYYIVTPKNAHQVRAVILCSKKLKLELRIRGGGHDYEGISYASTRPFVMLDMVNIRNVDVNVKNQTAWVGAGTILGELYYHIAEKSDNKLGFPAGVCPTVGLGGYISGGGQGMMMRKYGLATDNVIDAIIVDANGRILDKQSMGEDLFWAIRGGGASSFGVVVSWKLRLVRLPPKVTVFAVTRTQEEGANRLIFRWQEFLDEMPKELFVRIMVMPTENSLGQPIMKAGFHSLFLGRRDKLLKIMEEKLPELKVKAKDCKEMSWINSTLFFDFIEGKEAIKDLLDRSRYNRGFFKGKSDYVSVPIRESILNAVWDVFNQGVRGTLLLQPYGGRVAEIPVNQTAFPHRKGTLYNIHYFTMWHEDRDDLMKKHMDWINTIYNYMGSYVANPRVAYSNYRDLDLGKNEYLDNRYEEANTWGHMYYKENFKRLAQIKHQVDPENFFRHEQSIPPLRERYDI